MLQAGASKLVQMPASYASTVYWHDCQVKVQVSDFQLIYALSSHTWCGQSHHQQFAQVRLRKWQHIKLEVQHVCTHKIYTTKKVAFQIYRQKSYKWFCYIDCKVVVPILLVFLSLPGRNKPNPSLQSWNCFSICCHCPIQKTQSLMIVQQKGHHGNPASSRFTWLQARQTISAPVYHICTCVCVQVHSTMNLFSVLFIMTGLSS